MKSKCEFTTFRTLEFLPNKPSLYLNPIPAGVLEKQNMLGGVNLTPPPAGIGLIYLFK